MKSYTVAKAVELAGRALLSGAQVRAVIAPADVGSGIAFVREGVRIAATPQHFGDFPNCTTLSAGGRTVAVTEHLMAALWAAGIDTAEIAIDGDELPNQDGSALWQYEQLAAAGRVELGERRRITHDNSITVGDAQAFIIWTPGPGLEVTYFFDHPELGEQAVAAELDREFAAEAILPARSFITETEARQAIAAGFLRNENEQDALVIKNGRPNANLRFADEYARHKVLDLLGDLYHVPAELTGRIAAFHSGHRLNRALARELAATLDLYDTA